LHAANADDMALDVKQSRSRGRRSEPPSPGRRIKELPLSAERKRVTAPCKTVFAELEEVSAGLECVTAEVQGVTAGLE
jgi:hypothetical protein